MTDKLTDQEISKICAELMGVEYKRTVGVQHRRGYELRPDPFNPIKNKEDWADLVFFCVNEWEDWWAFRGKVDATLTMLISNTRALPTALAEWDKEGETDRKKPCSVCGGKKTILTKEDRLGLKYIIDCPTCNGI